MNPKDHPLLYPRNILELIFQTPVWMLVYGSGLVLFLTAFNWFVYGIGQHIHPKKYPLPHVLILDFLAETMIWVREESNYSQRSKKALVFLLSSLILLGVPIAFFGYASYLFWLYPIGEWLSKLYA